MRHVPDRTGRLSSRPHYEPAELDAFCENLIRSFVQHLHGDFALPIATDDLEKLIERDASDLDLYADLSAEGDDVQGVTYFIPHEKPRVCISSALSADPYRENRLRTTLTHEYGHVALHAPLWNTPATQLSLFLTEALEPTNAEAQQQRCHRSNILGGTAPDWMEWQAGYVCGALLMPLSSIGQATQVFFEKHRLPTRIESSNSKAVDLQRQIADLCAVSRDAARVRLTQLGYLVDHALGTPFAG